MKKILYHTCHHASLDTEFWEGVRSSLQRNDCELVISLPANSSHTSPDNRRLDMWLTAPPPAIRTSIESQLDWPRLELCAQGYREHFDRSEIVSQALSLSLHLALEHPDLVLVYNDRRREGNLLRQLCHIYKIPCVVVERLPWPMWLSVDPGGMLLECELFQDLPDPYPSPCPIFDEYARIAGKNKSTWWEQPHDIDTPSLRKILPAEKKILLFVHQVDEDAQNFAYNPLFKDNAEALSWLVAHLPSDGSVVILGKHHPKSTSPASLYAEILGAKGYWSTTHSIEECLSHADAIVAVNSSLLFEAILTSKPVGCLGLTVLQGRGVFNELQSLADTEFISRLMATPSEELRQRLARFRHYTEHTLKHAFCLKPQASATYARRGPQALGEHILQQIPAVSSDGLNRMRDNVLEWMNFTLTLHSWMIRSRIMKLAWRLSAFVSRMRNRA